MRPKRSCGGLLRRHWPELGEFAEVLDGCGEVELVFGAVGSSKAEAIEADIAATRSRMSRTVDELTYRINPQTLKTNAVASLKGKANDAAFQADGTPRYDRLAMGLGGVSGAALLLGVLRRTFHRG